MFYNVWRRNIFMNFLIITNLLITTVLHQMPKSLYAKLQRLYHLLIPSGYNKTITTNFEPNLKKALLHADQDNGYWLNSSQKYQEWPWIILFWSYNSISYTKLYDILWQAYILIDFPPVYFLPTHVWSSTSCKVESINIAYRSENMGLLFLHEQQLPTF